MTNGDRARMKRHVESLRKRIGDLQRPEDGSRQELVIGLIIEGIDALESECVPVRKSRGKRAEPGPAAEAGGAA